MEFEVGKAIVAGVVGTLAMTVVMYMGSMLMGLKMDIPMTLGTMLLRRGTGAWLLGLMMHLMLGAIFFIIYAALFQAFGIRSGVIGWSAVFGVVHAVMAGLAFGMMPALHPRMATMRGNVSGEVPAPGYFGLKLGAMAPMAVVGVHVVYAVVAALVYLA
ncbi:MAG: hypothetical protein HYU30_08920 [Chloroflexi bacterium]|nr:hypothetical protein [Chloroflexota bacterium]